MIRWLRRVLPRRHTVDDEIRDEVEFHLAQRTEDLVRAGTSPAEARMRAEREFGDVAAARRELADIDRRVVRAESRSGWLTDLGLDLRFGIRLLKRSPGFCFAVLATLGIAIGANTAIFSVFQAALLQALPYEAPDALYQLSEYSPASSDSRSEVSWPDFADWRAEAEGLIDLEGYDPTNITLSGRDGAEMLGGGRVTTGFFQLLGVRAALGRTFTGDEEQPGGAPVAVLSDGYWRARFAADPAVLDSTISVDGRPYQVIGVLPAAFHFAPIGDAAIWFPLDGADGRRQQRFNKWLNVIGRLRQGVTAQVALARLEAAMERLAREFPETNAGGRVVAEPLAGAITGGIRPTLVMLLLAMTAVLAIACANVAGLHLARALGRQREIVVRTALGASRWRIARQLLVESVMLAAGGGILGIALARVGVRAAIAAMPAGMLDHLPFFQSVGLNPAVLAYTLAVTLIAGVSMGMGPIMHLVGHAQGAVSRTPRATASPRLIRLRDGLIIGEVALTLALLAATALLGRSLASLLRLELGFRPEQVVAVRVALSGPRYQTGASQQLFFSRLLEQVRSIPGVSSVGAVSQLPLRGGGTGTVLADGEPIAVGSGPSAVVRQVGGDYFRTLGIPLLGGRPITVRDDSASTLVAVVSRSLAEELFPPGEALGRRIRFVFSPANSWEVVGIVGDVRTGPLDRPPPPTVYLSHLQPAANRMSLVVRTAADPEGIIGQVRRAVREMDPDAAVYAAGSLSHTIRDSEAVAIRRLPLILLGAFGGAALLLAVVGLYGVIAFAVNQRSREFAIRIALGASPRQVEGIVVRYGLLLAGLGIGGGLGLAVGMSRLLETLLFGIEALDWRALSAATALVALVALAASWLPARRVLRVDPAVALRAD